MRKILRVEDNAVDLYELIQERIGQSVGLDDAPLDLTKTFEEIRKDIHRTYLVRDSAVLREELFRVLAAIAYVKPSIAYCQGMNFIVAVLLSVMGSEEVGFWMFLAMLKKFEMESMFVPGVPDLALREYQLNYYLKLNLPELSTHFRRVGVTNAFFVSRWFLTLFSVYLPYATLLPVWDCFFLQGWKVLIKVGIALFSSIEQELLAADLDEISMVIRDTLRTQQLEPQALLARAWRVHVSNAELQRMETQFFLDQAKIKLNAIEHTLGYSDSEINAFRWAKSELESLDSGTQTNVKELQRKLEKMEKDLDWYDSTQFLQPLPRREHGTAPRRTRDGSPHRKERHLPRSSALARSQVQATNAQTLSCTPAAEAFAQERNPGRRCAANSAEAAANRGRTEVFGESAH